MTREATKGMKKKKIVEEEQKILEKEQSQQKKNAERTATLSCSGGTIYNRACNKILNSVAKMKIHLNLVVLRGCVFFNTLSALKI